MWIRIRIRIRGFMPLSNGSGSCYFRHWPSRGHQESTGVVIVFFCLFLFEGTFTSFFKDKKSKKSQNNRNQGFSYYFCLMIAGSGSGSGSIPLTKGSHSRSPNTYGSYGSRSGSGSASLDENGSLSAVLRIHDILGWIRIRNRIRGSMHLTNPDPSIFVIDL